MGCAPSGLDGAKGSYKFLVENRTQTARIEAIFSKQFAKNKIRSSFTSASPSNAIAGGSDLILSHKGLTDTPYRRNNPEITRTFFIKQNAKTVEKRISRHGLQQLDMPDDGNCLFRSLSTQLHGHSDKHLEIRNKIAFYMESEKENLLVHFDSMEQLTKYIEDMKKVGTWGDELTLLCAAEKFQVEVHVLTSDDENFYRHYKPTFTGETKDVSHRHLFLSFISPVHFQPICTPKMWKRSQSIVDVR